MENAIALQPMKKIFIFLFCFPYFVKAQQDAQFSHYVYNQMTINPAAAGNENFTRFQAIYRTQYLGYQSTFDGNSGVPISQVFSVSMPIKGINSGLGITLVNDKIGASTQRDMKFSYAYQLPIGVSKLSFGINAGLFSRGIDFGKLRPREDNDPLLASGRVGQMVPDFGAGVMLQNSSYTIGISMNHLTQPKFRLGTGNTAFQVNRSAYLTASALLGVSYSLDFSPMLIVKSDLKTTSFEGGGILTYRSNYWVGASYRMGDALSGLLGANLIKNTLRISYAIDLTLIGKNAKAPTSHEVLLSYALSPPKIGKKSIIRTPRYRYE